MNKPKFTERKIPEMIVNFVWTFFVRTQNTRWGKIKYKLFTPFLHFPHIKVISFVFKILFVVLCHSLFNKCKEQERTFKSFSQNKKEPNAISIFNMFKLTNKAKKNPVDECESCAQTIVVMIVNLQLNEYGFLITEISNFAYFFVIQTNLASVNFSF
jgi:hypothetical protein